MKYGTSLRVRHIVGRFEKGEELIDSMRRLCARERVRAGSFTAIGVLSSSELQRFEPSSREYVTCFQGDVALDIVHLSGNISTLGQEVIVNVSAELAYSSFGQRHHVGGHLASGRVFTCEFQLCSYDDLLLERTFDAATGLPLWNRIGGAALAELAGTEPLPAEPRRGESKAQVASHTPDVLAEAPLDDDSVGGVHVAQPRRKPEIIRRRPAAEPEPPEDEEELGDELDEEETEAAAEPATRPASRSAWDAAIQQAARNEARSQLQIPEGSRAPAPERRALSPVVDDDELDEEIYVQKGDILLHPTLGECVVARVDDDGESAYIKVGTRKPRKFALRMFDLESAGERNGRSVYKLVKKRERGRAR